MKRKASALALLAALGGCVSADKTGPAPGHFGTVSQTRTVPGVQGPYGEPVPIVQAKASAPATAPKSSGVVQAGAKNVTSSGIQQTSGNGPVAGCAECEKGVPGHSHPVVNHFASKNQGPPKVISPRAAHLGAGGVAPPPGSVAAVGALPGIPVYGGMGIPGMGAARTSIRFTAPTGLKVAWFAPSQESPTGFTQAQVEAPGRYNFIQGGVYRLKLTDIPNRPQVELYPTLEVMPATHRTGTFLAHSAVPVSFTEEDFEQVAAGNMVVKVIYLPDPQFQDLAVAGPDEIISTRLEPGVDPILEAQRRGTILCVIRLGNIDLEAPNTPAMNAPPTGNAGAMMGPFGGMPMMTAPGAVPPGAMPPGAPAGLATPTAPPVGTPAGALPLPNAAPGLAPTPVVPGAVPTPPRIPSGTAVPPAAGRSSISVPSVPLPIPAAPVTQTGSVTATVDGMIGRMK